jgi:DNA invertase Pin-like site-specific DNA recombinase
MPRTDAGKIKVGYARVSSLDQDLSLQIEQLRAEGCERIYREKVSGATRQKRAELRKMLRELEAGDTVVVTKIDRLARSVFDLFAILKEIDEKGAHFLCMSQRQLDTSTSMGRMLLAVLAGIADWEREMIRTRTDEGRERAKARGVKFGRKASLTNYQKREALDRRAGGESIRDIARSFNVSHTTIARLGKDTT